MEGTVNHAEEFPLHPVGDEQAMKFKAVVCAIC